MAAVHAQAGDIQEAKNMAANFVATAEIKLTSLSAQLPKSWLGFVAERWPFKHSADMEHFLEGLRKAGLPD